MKKIFQSIKKEAVFVYTELKKTYSDKDPSYFSSKRIERSLLFMTALISSNVWFWTHYPGLTYEQVIAYIVTHLGFAGYTMRQTQKEKIQNKEQSDEMG